MVKWATEKSVVAGDRLIADDGFTCIESGTVLIVHEHEVYGLHVLCSQGTHSLDGQLNEANEYVGFIHAKVEN